LTLLGYKQLVLDRVQDHGGEHVAPLLERQRDGEVRQAVQEVAGAVERIDDPATLLVILAFDAARFLQQKAEVRPRALEFLPQDLLGLEISGRDEISRSLAGHL